MHVRPATPADTRGAAEVIATIAEEGTIAAEPPVDVEARAGTFLAMVEGEGRSALWVLDADGAVVGVAGLHETEDPRVRGIGMAILGEHRGRGGGRALLEALAESARAAGVERLVLEVWPENERAIGLYAAAGFEHRPGEEKRYPRRDGSERPALVMTREL